MRKVDNTSAPSPESPVQNFNDIGKLFGTMMNPNFAADDNIIDTEGDEINDENDIIDSAPDEADNNIEVDNDISNESEETNNEKEIEELPQEEYVIVKTATPFNISINTAKNNKKVATIYFLCRDIEDNLFMIDRNLIIDTEDDQFSIESLPFTEDPELDFPSRKIVAHSLNAYLPSFITNMEFYVDDDFDRDKNPMVYIYGTNINSKESIKMKMSADIFACMNFVDDYIYGGINCEHDLALATVVGSKVLDTPAEFFLVDKVDSIVSMASTTTIPERKGLAKLFNHDEDAGTTIGLVIKVNKFISNSDREIAYILTPFDVGVTYDRSKYRGKTIENIQNEYFGEADQYVATLTTMNTKLHGIDKEYMIIRGKTKDKKVRLFLFDSYMQEELKHLIDIY